MSRRTRTRKPPVVTAGSLLPKTIRIHDEAWREIERRAKNIAPAEWLRSAIYETILDDWSPPRESAA